jgi:hypothetical protein
MGKSHLALPSVGPGVLSRKRFHGRRVTKSGPASQTRAFSGCGPQFSIADAQQVLPLAKVPLEPHALGDLKCRDDAAFDLLAALGLPVRRLTGIPCATGRGEPRICRARWRAVGPATCKEWFPAWMRRTRYTCASPRIRSARIPRNQGLPCDIWAR